MKNNILYLLIITFLFFLVSCSNVDSQDNLSKDFYIASWNIENLFDTIDDKDKIDEWFLPSSEIKWTEKRLELKLKNLAKVISIMNDGDGPDLLGVQEVEHESLLKELLNKIKLDKNYKIVYEESPDARGIDNGLIYNSDLFEVVKYNGITVPLDNNKKTRLILHAELKIEKEIFHIFVNHWPSRREGLKISEKNRIKAAETLMKEINSINNNEANIIIMGDFNDLPSNLSISKYLNAKAINCETKNNENFYLYNISYNDFENGLGTYKYKNHWNMLDQIILSNSFFDKVNYEYECNSFKIYKPSFLVQKEGKYKGTSLPTYGGRKYLKGYSDHFSIGAKINYIVP